MKHATVFMLGWLGTAMACSYGDWSDWGACSESCAGGQQTRVKTLLVDTGAMISAMVLHLLIVVLGGCNAEQREMRTCNTQLCPVGTFCVFNSKCESNVCKGNQCTQANCLDSTINQGESDTDCGGPTTCGFCKPGKRCTLNSCHPTAADSHYTQVS